MSAEEIESTHDARIRDAARRDLQRHLTGTDVEKLPEWVPTALERMKLMGAIGR